LEDRRNVGGSSCFSGDGTDQRVQSLMFMMMIFVKMEVSCIVWESDMVYSLLYRHQGSNVARLHGVSMSQDRNVYNNCSDVIKYHL
jgi:hypothetical protein